MSILDTIAQVESGNRNIPNTTANNPSGQPQGYYQITTGTWKDFAPVAGVDLKQYPNALSAPQDVQAQVASSIPLSRWAPGTVAAVQNQFGAVDTSLPVGVLQAGGGQSTLAHDNVPVIDVGPYDPNAQPGAFGSEFAPAGTQTQAGTTQGGTVSTLGAGQPGYLPPAATGGAAATGITPGLAAGITGWIGGIETAVGNAFKSAFAAAFGGIQNWFARAFLILLAIGLIITALWAMLSKSETVQRMASTAAKAA